MSVPVSMPARGAAKIGKTYTVRGLARDLVRLVPMLPRTVAIWGFRRVSPRFREEIMLTVARTNGCRYCSYIHQEWAIRTGVPDEEIAQLEGLDPAVFDRAKWSALVYARALTEADFGPVADEISHEVRGHYTDRERKDIETVALAMSIVNRSANTMDGLGARLRRDPVPGGSLPAELLITSALALAGPLVVPALALILRRSPRRLWREFQAYSAKMRGEERCPA